MRHTRHAPAVTSLPQSPQDEATHRVRRYALTMGIRTVCFLLMALVPMGWWTWVFAAGAIFLPYIAVVYANAGSDSTPSTIESPTLQLGSGADAPAPQTEEPAVYTVHERRDVAGDDAGEDAAPVPEPADADAGEDPDAEQDGSSSTGPASDARGHDSDDAA
ncbi:DUF3099 domain-containing protein [Microbacterium sp. YJN-G]|uniref:DUF3099 domain-containing protein n=1 Tax=Microbacterium sp. YJN-G TaxID=2763257 RepID=UPI0018775E53|nr:DUF3099 domain-containing protein [Microbacterium sp. YJN-G]